MRCNQLFVIIFLTNYDDYAKDGYLVQAYRYISKSSEKEFTEAMKSLEKMFRNRKKIVVPDIVGDKHILSHRLDYICRNRREKCADIYGKRRNCNSTDFAKTGENGR